MVMFDLPMTTAAEKKSYRKFRKFLIENGYAMLQYSVYVKIILNHSALHYQKTKVMQYLPPNGHVELLIVTEKQFAAMEHFSKPTTTQQQVVTTDRIVEL